MSYKKRLSAYLSAKICLKSFTCKYFPQNICKSIHSNNIYKPLIFLSIVLSHAALAVNKTSSLTSLSIKCGSGSILDTQINAQAYNVSLTHFCIINSQV